MKAQLVVGLLIAGMTTIAKAEPIDDAKAAFATGKQAFERGDYETALKEFQRANLIAPAPSLSYNIGKTYEALGRYNDAALAFERYLELAGAPQTDEDKQFQENLRARIQADKKRPDRGATTTTTPQPQPQPLPQPPPAYPPNYYQQPPAYQQPYYQQPYYQQPAYTPPIAPKAVRLDLARRKRNSGISSFSVGVALFVIGLAITVDAAIVPHGDKEFSPLSNVSNEIEIAVGIPCAIIGPILIGAGANNWGKGQREMNAINREVVPGQPAAFILHSPTVVF